MQAEHLHSWGIQSYPMLAIRTADAYSAGAQLTLSFQPWQSPFTQTSLQADSGAQTSPLVAHTDPAVAQLILHTDCKASRVQPNVTDTSFPNNHPPLRPCCYRHVIWWEHQRLFIHKLGSGPVANAGQVQPQFTCHLGAGSKWKDRHFNYLV